MRRRRSQATATRPRPPSISLHRRGHIRGRTDEDKERTYGTNAHGPEAARGGHARPLGAVADGPHHAGQRSRRSAAGALREALRDVFARANAGGAERSGGGQLL